MSFTCKGFTFLAFCSYFVVEISTFLLVVTSTDSFANTDTHLQTDSSTFPKGWWIFWIQSTLSIFCMTILWIPLLFSKRYCMAGRTSCFPRRKVNSNVDITSGFEDLASRTSKFVRMLSSKNARAFTAHRGDLKR